tara:strand:- start:1117 stop:1311 length:195 start_codon:yes stop_codon:yes gene_type:complete
MLIGKNFRLIKEFKPQKAIVPIINKIIKLVNNSTKEGSKNNLLYLSNKKIRNKNIKAVDPTGER